MYLHACARIARKVPRSNSVWFGMVSVCARPCASRRSFTWLPRCAKTENPNFANIRMTSLPDNTLSRGIRFDADFEICQDGRLRGQTKLRQILPFQLERHRFLNILDQFVQSFTLRHNRQINALSHVIFLTLKNMELDNPFHAPSISQPQ